MEFLKSTVSRAVFGKDVTLSFTIGNQVDNFTSSSIWTLHDGKKKDDGTSISVFVFNSEKHPDKIDLARNAFKRARTIRHPALLTFIDGVENDKSIIIATEKVIPLTRELAKEKDNNLITWGLYKIAVALKFLNSDCQLIHGSVRKASIFSTLAGEWKLGGLELCCSLKDNYPIIMSNSTSYYNPSKYSPPEVRNESWSAIQRYPLHVVDAYSYGCLIYELFNDTTISDPSEVRNLSKIPSSVQAYYKNLLQDNPNFRSSVAQFLDNCMQKNSFFDTPFVQACLFLENISVKEKSEKEQFIRNLSSSIDSFPTEFSKHKILPELIKALEYGAGGSRVLLPILKLGSSLSKQEYEKVILNSIIKMYGSPDRQMRLMLLENMDKYIDQIGDHSKIINDKIFPQIVSGFTDTSSIIREATVKSILLLGPKLSDRIINNDLLRYLAKMQIDEEPGIRTNTTILIGKISKNLSSSTRKRILVPAFARSLKDPFVPARNAGLLALIATIEYFDVEEMSSKVIPVISPCLIDPDKTVRQNAFKAINTYIKKLEIHSDNMYQPPPQDPNSISNVASENTLNNNQDSKSWGGWTSTISKKIQGTMENMIGSTNSSLNGSQSINSLSSSVRNSSDMNRKSYDSNSQVKSNNDNSKANFITKKDQKDLLSGSNDSFNILQPEKVNPLVLSSTKKNNNLDLFNMTDSAVSSSSANKTSFDGWDDFKLDAQADEGWDIPAPPAPSNPISKASSSLKSNTLDPMVSSFGSFSLNTKQNNTKVSSSSTGWDNFSDIMKNNVSNKAASVKSDANSISSSTAKSPSIKNKAFSNNNNSSLSSGWNTELKPSSFSGWNTATTATSSNTSNTTKKASISSGWDTLTPTTTKIGSAANNTSSSGWGVMSPTVKASNTTTTNGSGWGVMSPTINSSSTTTTKAATNSGWGSSGWNTILTPTSTATATTPTTNNTNSASNGWDSFNTNNNKTSSSSGWDSFATTNNNDNDNNNSGWGSFGSFPNNKSKTGSNTNSGWSTMK